MELSQVLTALQRADAAGNTEDARELARIARRLMHEQRNAPAPVETVRRPKEESLAADLGYSALSGLGSLVAFPGQAYGLATGDTDNSLSKMGQSITDYAKSKQSEGLKARQAAQQAAIAEADKEGVLSGYGTAITSTLKDPVLFGNFIAENIANMIPGFGLARGTMGVGMRMAAKEVAAQGLQGEAKDLALKAARGALTKKATAAAVGVAAVQQGSDVGAQAYEDIYKKLVENGTPAPDAAAEALSLARAAGLSGAAISYLSSRLPGARALEEAFVGSKGARAAATGALKGFLGEGASEAVEEGGGKFAQNVAMSTVDPTQNIMQGVGSAAGMGTVLGGTLGAGAGALNSSRDAAASVQETLYNQQQAAANRALAQQTAAAARAQQLQDPAYIQDLLARVQAADTKRQQLVAAAEDKTQTGLLGQTARAAAKKALAEFDKSDDIKALIAELTEAAPAIAQYQAIAASTTASTAAPTEGAVPPPAPFTMEGRTQDTMFPETGGVDPQAQARAAGEQERAQYRAGPTVVGYSPTDGSPIFAPAAQAEDVSRQLQYYQAKAMAATDPAEIAEYSRLYNEALQRSQPPASPPTIPPVKLTPLAKQYRDLVKAVDAAREAKDMLAMQQAAEALQQNIQEGGKREFESLTTARAQRDSQNRKAQSAFAREQKFNERQQEKQAGIEEMPTMDLFGSESRESFDARNAQKAAQEAAQEAERARERAALDEERNAPTGPIAAEESGEPEAMAIEAARREADAAAKRLKELTDRATQAREDFAAGERGAEPTDNRRTDQADLFAEPIGVTRRRRTSTTRKELEEDLREAQRAQDRAVPGSMEHTEATTAVRAAQEALNQRPATSIPTASDAVRNLQTGLILPVESSESRYSTGQAPRSTTRESLQAQIDRLPKDLRPDDEALVQRIQDNLGAIAANKGEAEMVREWLYRLSTTSPDTAPSRVDDLLARDITRAMDAYDRGRLSETETTETQESKVARNAADVRKTQRIPLLQQRIADQHNALLESSAGRKYARLYRNVVVAMQRESDLQVQVAQVAQQREDANALLQDSGSYERIEARRAQLASTLEQLNAALKAARAAKDAAEATRLRGQVAHTRRSMQLADAMRAVDARLATVKKLAQYQEELQGELDAVQETKRMARIQLYAASGGVDPNRQMFEQLEKDRAELAQLSQEPAIDPKYTTQWNAGQRDMFPELPSQGRGATYVPATRSDIGTADTAEAFQEMLGSEGLQRYRESLGLSGITATRAQKLLEPIKARIDELNQKLTAARDAINKRRADTAQQRAEIEVAKNNAAARLQAITLKIADDLAEAQTFYDQFRKPYVAAERALADAIAAQEGKEHAIARTLDLLDAAQENESQAEYSGALPDEMRLFRAKTESAVAEMSAAVDAYMNNAPGEFRALAALRKKTQATLEDLEPLMRGSQKRLQALASEVGAFYSPEKKKAAQDLREAVARLTQLGSETETQTSAVIPPRQSPAVTRLGAIAREKQESADREASRQQTDDEKELRAEEAKVAEIEGRVGNTAQRDAQARAKREEDAAAQRRKARVKAREQRRDEREGRIQFTGFTDSEGAVLPGTRLTFSGHRRLVELQATAQGTADIYRGIYKRLQERANAGEANPTQVRDDKGEPITLASAKSSMDRAQARADRLGRILDRAGESQQTQLVAAADNAQKKVDAWAEKRAAAGTALGAATRAMNANPSEANTAAHAAAVKTRDSAVDQLRIWRERLAEAVAARDKGPGIAGMERAWNLPKEYSAYDVDPDYEPQNDFEVRLLQEGVLPIRRRTVLARKVSSAAGYGFRTGSPESRGEVTQFWLLPDGTIKKKPDGDPATLTVGPRENPINRLQEVGEIIQPKTPFGKKEQQESNRIAREITPPAPRAPKPAADGTTIPSAAATNQQRVADEAAESAADIEAEAQRAANAEAAALRGPQPAPVKVTKKESRLISEKYEPGESKRARSTVAVEDTDVDDQSDDDFYTGIDTEAANDWDNNLLRGTSGANDTPLSIGAIRRLGADNVRDALLQVASSSKNPIARRLAADYAGKVGGVRVVLVDEMPGTDPNAPGGITRDGMTIFINRNTGLSEESLLHEVAHALTIHQLDVPERMLTAEQRAAKRELEAMHEEIKKAADLDNDVVKQDDLKEFVAESYGSNQVQKHMKGRQWQWRDPNAPKRSRLGSMWDAAKSAFMRLIGAKVPPKGTPMHDRFMELADKFLRTPEKGDMDMRERAKSQELLYRSPLDAALKNGFSGSQSPMQALAANKGHLGLAIRQNIADQRAPLREMMSRVGTRDEKADMALTVTMMDAAASNTMATLAHGALRLDANGNFVGGTNTSFEAVLDEIAKFPGIKGEKALNLFHMQRVADRADAMSNGWQILAGRNNAAKWQADAQLVRDKIAASPALKAAVDRANTVYNEYNRGKLELLRDAYALPKDDIDKMLKDKSYVPFYRQNGDTINLIMPDGQPRSVGDIRTNPMLRALKGGDERLLGFVDSEVKNAHLLTRLAVENVAKQKIAKQLEALGKTRTATLPGKPSMSIRKGYGAKDANKIEFRVESTGPTDDGMRHIVINTEGTAAQDIPTTLLTQAVAGSYVTHNMITDVSNAMASLLRTAITRFPLYTVRQLFREPFAASVQGNIRSGPAMAVIKSIWEWGKIMADKSDEAKFLASHGIVESKVFGGTNDLSKVATQIAGGGTWWTDRVAMWLDKSALAADAATRTQAFKDVLARGGSQTEALLQAREMQNFSRHGSAAWVQFLGHSIPFFNSSIQSLDTLLRSARGQMPNEALMQTKRTFALRAAGMMALAAMYYAKMDDDEEWRKLTLRDKMSYIHLPIEFGGDRLRLPAPFEVGMLFYSLPIAMMEHLKYGLKPKDWEAVRAVIRSQLPASGLPVPLVARLPGELMTNYNLGLGAPIVPKSKQDLAPEAQYGPNTTEFARRVGEFTETSPYKIDYTLNQLVGQWAKVAGSATESLFQKARDANIEPPSTTMADNPIYGSLFQNKRSDTNIERVYAAAAEAREAKRTFDDLRSRGLNQDAAEFRTANAAALRLAPRLAKFASEMGNIRAMEERIRNMPSDKMSASEKRERLDMLMQRQQTLAKQFAGMLDRLDSE